MTAFVRPPVDPSDIVLVFRNPQTNDKDSEALAGMVVRVPAGAKGIDVSVGNILCTGMRHRSDPQLVERPDLLIDGRGCWDYSPQTRRTEAMEVRLAQLERTVAQLGEKVTKSLARKVGD